MAIECSCYIDVELRFVAVQIEKNYTTARHLILWETVIFLYFGFLWGIDTLAFLPFLLVQDLLLQVQINSQKDGVHCQTQILYLWHHSKQC